MILTLAALSLCPLPPAERFSCVVDGDTLWSQGEKVRIANIDAPELAARCPQEAVLARKARDRLLTLLQPGFTLHRGGEDRYGRTLARITINGRDVGEQLVREGLARPYGNGRRSWC